MKTKYIKMFKSKRVNYLGILLITIVLYELIYGLKTLDPTNINWLMSAYHDWGTHYLGWAFYRVEDWTFPLEATKNYIYPVGTNPGFTDSIPLLALLFKPFSAILPEDFQYFGIWMFLCHFLVGFYTFKIFELYKIKRVITYIAVIILVANPVLIFRAIHPALSSHWLFLASFYYYLLPTTPQNATRINNYQVLIFFIAAGVNPYIGAMIFGFNIILPLKHYFIEKSIILKQLICYPILSFFLGIFYWFMIGMIEIGGSGSTNLGAPESFSLYSFNLNSFFNSYGFFSEFLPDYGFVNSKQYEGFAYFGLGMLVLTVISVILFLIGIKKFKTKQNLKKYGMLLLLCVLLFLFSITNQITFGTKILLELPLPGIVEKLGHIFRASGRFVWALYYFIFIFSILIIGKSKINAYLKYTLLLFLLVIQLYDIQKLILKNNFNSGTYHTALDDEKWIPFLKNFDEIITYPPYQTSLLYNLDYQDLCFLALKAQKPITNGYVARIDAGKVEKFNDSLGANLTQGFISEKQVFITTPKDMGDFAVFLNQDKVGLRKHDGFIFIYSKDKKIKDHFSLNSKDKQYLDSLTNSLMIKRYSPTKGITVTESNAIKSYFDSFHFGNNALKAHGWAFLNSTKNNSKDSIFIVLKSGEEIYSIPTEMQVRTDITEVYKANLDNSGFKTIVMTDQFKSGSYDVWLAIKDAKGVFKYSKTDKKLEIHN